jgi:hypothetical protein
MWNHWAVRATTPHQPFLEVESAGWVWKHLREAFPGALAAVLMPNHLHLILRQEEDAAKLYGLLSAISRRFELPKLWQAISKPASIPDRHHLRRQVRYIALNPCRAKLCADPLEWPWSSYIDLMGASSDPWVTDFGLATILSETRRGFRGRFHAYVSGDPSVAVAGTAMPHASPPRHLPQEPLADILAAASAALRIPGAEVQKRGELRQLFIHLAWRQGWRKTGLLAQVCGVTPRAIRFMLAQTPACGLEAATLCLGDERLRQAWTAEFPQTGKKSRQARGLAP